MINIFTPSLVGGNTAIGVGVVAPTTSDEKKEKKKEKKKNKEKETRYATLGEDLSSNDEESGPIGGSNETKSPVKSKKSKPFMFGSAKKEKKKDIEVVDGGESASATASSSSKKKEKLKLKKSKQGYKNKEQDDEEIAEEVPIFGVPLDVAVERNKCHDGISLPAIVRQCIDYIEAEGLMTEGIYRSSGVKSKVNKIKTAYNNRKAVNLGEYDLPVVASVLKQFLRELPEPVLTDALTPKFERVSANPHPQKRIEGMKQLMSELPESNRLLIQWIFVHMAHVIERVNFICTKMLPTSFPEFYFYSFYFFL